MDAATIQNPIEFAPVPADGRRDGLVIVCDHASNAVPDWVEPLGLPSGDMARHIAWDVGARGLTLELARLLAAPAVLSTWSRLVIDPNRGEQDPTLVMKLYDGSVIPGNRGVDAGETLLRIERLHRPYHHAIDRALEEQVAASRAPALISIHSFTPQLRGRPIRPWHIGVLWDQDDRLATPLLARLANESDLVVGDNEPYSGALAGDCMWQHGTDRDIPHALIEVRNDLIATPEDQIAWAARLAPIIEGALSDLWLADPEPATPTLKTGETHG
ncbi:MAG: N-formylglutamate amidohydrolase [Paracoccaceae bacterium]